MQIHRTDLNLLAIFDSIYTQGSVTKAAEALHITQPSVSHALAKLRDRVDDPLFVRQGQRLVPTQVARQLIGPVRQSIQLLDSALTNLSQFDPATADQTFIIGMRPLMEGAFLPSLSRRLQAQAPSVQLSSVQFNRNNLESELVSGRIHLAVDVFLSVPEAIECRHLASARIVVLARKGHPAITSGVISQEDYLAANHLQVSSRPSGHGIEDLMLAREGLNRKITMRCQQMSTALDIARESDMLVTVAENLVHHLYDPDKHQIALAPFQTPEIDTYLYWHRTNQTDKGIQWLIQEIQDAYKLARVQSTPLIEY